MDIESINFKRKQISTLQEMYPEPSADIQAAIDNLKAQTGDAAPAAADPKDAEISQLRASLDAAMQRIAADAVKIDEQASDLDHLVDALANSLQPVATGATPAPVAA